MKSGEGHGNSILATASCGNSKESIECDNRNTKTYGCCNGNVISTVECGNCMIRATDVCSSYIIQYAQEQDKPTNRGSTSGLSSHKSTNLKNSSNLRSKVKGQYELDHDNHTGNRKQN